MPDSTIRAFFGQRTPVPRYTSLQCDVRDVLCYFAYEMLGMGIDSWTEGLPSIVMHEKSVEFFLYQ